MDPQQLAETFVELADTLVDDYDVIEVLERLAGRCADLLEVDAAGILVAAVNGQLNLAAASTEATRLLELFQLQEQEGPSLECYRTGQPVSHPDAAVVDDRWPRFSAAARKLGLGAVHAVPMRLRDATIGSLNLFNDRAGGFDGSDMRIAQALADAATIGILQYRAVSRREVLAEQLQAALNSRVVIEQAKGVLAERLGTDMQKAFTVLRDYARAHHVRLSEFAGQVVAGTIDPAVLVGTGRKGRPGPDTSGKRTPVV